MFGGKTGSLPSTSNHSYGSIPRVDIPRSMFNRSHGHKTTFNAGDLVPIYVDEALPGDTFNLNMSCFARLATPIVPVMDNLHADFFFFAVPYRLVWDNWQKFNGEQRNPGDSTSFLIPQMTASGPAGYVPGSLSDYFGIPTGVPGISHMSLFHRAYSLIWNEWFRDENLQNSVVVDVDDGPDADTDYVVLKRGKRYDYFTSCLPWPQKGSAVTLPLGSTAPIVTTGDAIPFFKNTAGTYLNQYLNSTSGTTNVNWASNAPSSSPMRWQDHKLQVDLSSATGAAINAIRQAFQIQKLLERDARGGTRYTEILRSHFQVVSPDQRVQRPEFLGGGTRPVTISPIPQTSSTDATTPQGNLAAMGVFSGSNIGFTKSFTEHCLLIGMVSVRADLTYQQGLDRMWSRSTRYDFYWPALSHIGEQAVLNREIYAQGSTNPTSDVAVFGYQERYGEYRSKLSKVTGLFRSTTVGSLDIWHLAQMFNSLPTLGSTFIQENPPVGRITATTTEPDFLFDSYFDLKCARPMPVYGVPGMIDRF